MSNKNRPKSIKKSTFKLPDELKRLIRWNARRHRPMKSDSDWLKDAAEFRCIIILGMHIGLYNLVKMVPGLEEELGLTISQKVGPKKSLKAV